jgi:multiple sugar transport system permease protein
MTGTECMKQHYRSACLLIILAPLITYAVFPILWMVSSSLKPFDEVFSIPPTWVPQHPTLTAYKEIWTVAQFSRLFLNSTIIALSTAVISTFAGLLAAYGLSRFKGKMRISNLLLTFILLTQMFPEVLLITPYFKLMSTFGLINTYWALIAATVSFALPFCTWLLVGFLESVPKTLDEAARIDGCSYLSTFFRIIVPLSKPGIFATVIFGFLLGWKSFLFPLVLSTSWSMYVVPVGIASFSAQHTIAWNQLMAAAVLATIPGVLLFLFVERYLVQGLTSGAVKG